MTEPVEATPTGITPAASSSQGESTRELLSDLQGRWVGEGINVLWVPALEAETTPQPTYNPMPGAPPRPLPRFVSSRTSETLSVHDHLGSVPNKGPKDDFTEAAAPYDQKSFDENGNLIHAENGFWLVTPATQGPAPSVATVAKLSSVPHGTVAIVQGPLPNRQDGQSQASAIDTVSVMPSGDLPQGLAKPTGPLAQEYIDDVATYVRQRMNADRTGVLWELQLQSTGVANIAFLETNARVTSIKSTVWIGNLGIRTDAAGGQVASVLAYVQTALIQFDGIDWPHVRVKSSEVVYEF